MQQQISVITLGISDLPRSRRFYVEGFGWNPVFENDEIIFYQMNGLVLGTFEKSALEKDMNRFGPCSPGAFSLAHNVPSQADVEILIEQLVKAGGCLIKPADAPSHGGFRGYVVDPDDHAWEIAWNPSWLIDQNGHVTFAVDGQQDRSDLASKLADTSLRKIKDIHKDQDIFSNKNT